MTNVPLASPPAPPLHPLIAWKKCLITTKATRGPGALLCGRRHDFGQLKIFFMKHAPFTHIAYIFVTGKSYSKEIFAM
jgi:hypothetical protein